MRNRLAIMVLVFLLSSGVPVQAAELSFEASSPEVELSSDASSLEVKTNETLDLRLVLTQEEGEVINAVDGKVLIPQPLLKLVSINTDDSIVNYWVIEPTAQELRTTDSFYTELNFSGIILNGYEEEVGELFSITVEGREEGVDLIKITSSEAYLNNGEGEPAELTIESFSIAVVLQSAEERSALYALEQETVEDEGIVTKDTWNTASKCEFIVMNGRAAGWDQSAEWSMYSALGESQYFEDVNEALVTWCIPYADYAYEHEIIEGREEGVFGVEGTITRFEVATIIANQAAEEFELEALQEQVSTFSDDADIVDWARAGVGFLSTHGIFNGFDNMDGTFTFGGDADILKVDAAIVLWRTFWD